MRIKVAGTAAVLLQLAFIAGAHADAREDLAKEVHEEISKRHITCIREVFTKDACGGVGVSCGETTAAITDFQSDIAKPDTQRGAVFRWWKFVSSDQLRSNCMRALLGTATYCKTVNLAAKFDPHRNCPDAGSTNATCWVNPNWEREWTLLPSEENEWTQRCKVDPIDRDTFEE